MSNRAFYKVKEESVGLDRHDLCFRNKVLRKCYAFKFVLKFLYIAEIYGVIVLLCDNLFRSEA